MKAVIYARYSSDSQREESIEGQIRECTAFDDVKGDAAAQASGSDIDCSAAPKCEIPQSL